MMKSRLVLMAVVLTVISTSSASSIKDHPPATIPEVIGGVPVKPELVENGKSLEPEQIIKVTNGVYMAFGYALGNSIMIEGPLGLIIVDTTECLECARRIYKEFRKISLKPIVAIILTHNHVDHTYGTEAFMENEIFKPMVISHELEPSIAREFYRIGGKLTRGAVHQFGLYLGGQLYSAGIGRRIFHDGAKLAVGPTTVIKTDTTMILAGLTVQLIYIPGETKDQIGVWLPNTGVLLPADDIYRTYPNLYAIRGTTPRNVLDWHDSLEKMRKLKPHFLVPSHTKPVIGQQEIYDLFTVYMAGIRVVHDQTVRWLNFGLHPDEIGYKVGLPKSISSHEYMQQFYGTTFWSSKGVYESYVGWFSGSAVDLFPLTPMDKAKRMVESIGDSKLLELAESALTNNDLQWALELSSYVFTVQPDNYEARDVRLRVLRALASQQANPPARNFYLTAALDDHKLIDWRVNTTQVIMDLTMNEVLNLMKYSLRAEETDGVNKTVVFTFQDINQCFSLQVLYSVLTVNQLTSCSQLEGIPYEANMITTNAIFKDIIVRRRFLSTEYSAGNVKLAGSYTTLSTFLSYIGITG